jgi:hypothetical protein
MFASGSVPHTVEKFQGIRYSMVYFQAELYGGNKAGAFSQTKLQKFAECGFPMSFLPTMMFNDSDEVDTEGIPPNVVVVVDGTPDADTQAESEPSQGSRTDRVPWPMIVGRNMFWGRPPWGSEISDE